MKYKFKFISPNKKYVIPQSLKEKYVYPQKGKKQKYAIPKSLKKTHVMYIIPHKFKGQPLAESN